MIKGELPLSYSIEIDGISETDWSDILLRFRDATINQTWSFGQFISGKVTLSHLVLKKNGEIVGACQIRQKTLGFANLGLAYAACGPMWQLRNKQDDIENFRQMVIALNREYAQKRGLFLIVKPNTFDCDSNADDIAVILKDANFNHSQSDDRTIMIDLNLTLEDLRKGLHQKWRNQLNCAERNNLQISEGNGDDLFVKFRRIYEEMLVRKRYANAADIDNFDRVRKSLAHSLKPRIVICESNGELMAGAVFSIIGDTAFYFLGATSNSGMKSKASYLVQWSIIRWLKEHGYRAYDLGSISPDTTPETYHFKAGICGKNENNGKDTRRIGEFTVCKNLTNSIVIKSSLKIRETTQRLKLKFASIS